VKAGLAARAGLVCVTIAVGLLAGEAPRFTRVALLLPACTPPGLAADELRGALSLDLRDEGLELATAGEFAQGDALVRVEAACPADAELTLRIELENESYTRRIDLRELPLDQRARALSLSLAELLALLEQGQLPPAAATQTTPTAATPAPSASALPPPAAASTSEPNPSPAAKPAPPLGPSAPEPATPGRPDDRRAAPALDRDWQLALAPELRFFQNTTLWGGRALGQYRAWCAGLDFLSARQSATAGMVTTYLAHVSLAYHFALLRADTSALEAGPRLGAGRTFMNARASGTARAADAQDLYLDAAFGARYALRLSSAFRLGIGAELGYARGPIGYADDLPLARTSGAFASLLLDGALRL
jgi:hypothetical protein